MKKFKVILVLSLLYAALLWFDFPRIANLIQNSANAEVTEPSQRDKYITISVTELMKKEHISEWTLNEKLSERTITSFLKVLDPQKLYFYQSDVDYFRARQPQLGDMFKNGDIKLAYVIFKTYLNRLDERISQMQTALEQPIDFTIDESMTIEPKKLTNPKTRKEAEERVRLRVKYDMLLLQVDDLRKEQKASKDSAEENGDEADSKASEDGAKDETPKTPEEKIPGQ